MHLKTHDVLINQQHDEFRARSCGQSPGQTEFVQQGREGFSCGAIVPSFLFLQISLLLRSPSLDNKLGDVYDGL
ncbi:hypothetical protein LC605_11665 [Nostoc sp. CHAB 5836]|uniref:hypothetical protein n=1 Tax=Nostoc sp. CHAB 5836 TaxID=2780404 RepID=UPI001E6157FF|nr:hypothetical protein [Nostoc sp. CHAB 5836]MCC5615716.1 hypothetical protein [Nostoc sp. CHAB 5836]